MDGPEVVIRPYRPLSRAEFVELWRYRELLGLLAWREIRVRYAQSLLGGLWAIIQPAGFALLFTLVLGPRGEGPGDALPYAVTTYAGLLPWMFFASIVTNAANSVVGAERLVTRVYFPRLLIPFSSLGSATLDLVVGAAPLLAILAWWGQFPGVRALAAIPLLACVAFLALGIGTCLAALNVMYRDVRHALPYAMQAWLLATPAIFLSGSSQGQPAQAPFPALWSWANPMQPLVTAVRGTVLGTLEFSWPLGAACATACLVLVLGAAWFRHQERLFADRI